jgi:ribonuclease HII
MKILFAEKAERRSFAVALASCLAKYARETAMDAFNSYFGELSESLEPTAGYTTDGRRWLEDAADLLARLELPRECLVRER